MLSPRRRLTTMLALAGIMLGSNAMAEGLGLRIQAGDELWPRWQARLLTSTSFSLWRHAALDRLDFGQQRQESLSLLGDYYFSPQSNKREELSGFRATSGLIIGSLGSQALSSFGDASGMVGRSAAAIAPPSYFGPRGLVSSLESSPYVGIGYTNSPARAGWGFSADIGIAARSGGSAARFGRVFVGSQSLDDLLREMRLTPLLNVGVSYSF